MPYSGLLWPKQLPMDVKVRGFGLGFCRPVPLLNSATVKKY